MAAASCSRNFWGAVRPSLAWWRSFWKVVDEADGPEHQGKEEHIPVVPVPPPELLPAGQEQGHPDGQDKHQPAHGGGALLGHVPGGAILPDGLPRLPAAQQGDQDLPGNGGHAKGHNKAEDICHGQDLRSLSFSFVATAHGRRVGKRYYTTSAGTFPVPFRRRRVRKYSATTSRSSRG